MTDEIKELARAMNICKKQGLEYTPSLLHNILSNIKTSKAISECVRDFALKDIKKLETKINRLQTEIKLLEKIKAHKLEKGENYIDIIKKLQPKYNEKNEAEIKLEYFKSKILYLS